MLPNDDYDQFFRRLILKLPKKLECRAHSVNETIEDSEICSSSAHW